MIEVKPGASLSLQMHHRRSEHWDAAARQGAAAALAMLGLEREQAQERALAGTDESAQAARSEHLDRPEHPYLDPVGR